MKPLHDYSKMSDCERGGWIIFERTLFKECLTLAERAGGDAEYGIETARMLWDVIAERMQRP